MEIMYNMIKEKTKYIFVVHFSQLRSYTNVQILICAESLFSKDVHEQI